jgi:hypothetical protein
VETKQEHLLYCLCVTRNMQNVLLYHVRGAQGDLVGMDAWLMLPKQYRDGTKLGAYCRVRSWRIIESVVLTESTSAADCNKFGIVFLQAQQRSLLLEAVELDMPHNVACRDDMPPLRLRLLAVPVHAALDSFNRLLFIHRNRCTVCRVSKAKYKSINACTYGGHKAKYSALCKYCLRELFVKVYHGKSFECMSEDCVLGLEAKDELYFFSRALTHESECSDSEQGASGADSDSGSDSESDGASGATLDQLNGGLVKHKNDQKGIYALKDKAALAHGFGSWSALYVHECGKSAAGLAAPE